MLLDSIRSHAFAWSVAAAASLGLLAGLAPAPAPVVEEAPAGPAAWNLTGVAAIARRDDAPWSQLRQSALWGGGVETAEAAHWHLVGVVGDDSVRRALVMVDGEPDIRRVGNGDPLPDGGVVVDVGKYGMKINIFGCENLVLRLYVPGQRSPARDCGYAQTAPGAGASPTTARTAVPAAGTPAAARRPGSRPAGSASRASNVANRIRLLGKSRGQNSLLVPPARRPSPSEPAAKKPSRPSP